MSEAPAPDTGVTIEKQGDRFLCDGQEITEAEALAAGWRPDGDGDGDGSGEEAAPTATERLQGPSVLDTLREAYHEADAERSTVLMIVPGRFNSALAARYRPIPWTEQRRRIRRMAKQGDSEETELNYGAGLIAEACEEILVRTEAGGPLKPLHEVVPEFAGQPVRYDARLCQTLGIEHRDGMRGPQVCRLVFNNPQALNQHFAELEAFLREGAVDDEDEEGDGEGDGGRPT